MLELGRALRLLLSHADLDDSYLAPHVPTLLAQLFELWSGDARLQSPEATLAGAPPATPPAAASAAAAAKAAAAQAAHVGTSAAAAAEEAHAKSATPAATTASERAAAAKAAAPPASAAAPPPAWPDKAAAAAAMSDGSLVSRLAQSAAADGGATRYLSWVQPSLGPLEDWQAPRRGVADPSPSPPPPPPNPLPTIDSRAPSGVCPVLGWEGRPAGGDLR